MKRISLLLIAVMVATTLAASANPFSDVPFSHWAYDAVNKLAVKGILQGYPDGTFKGRQTVTRYAMAMVVAKLLSNVEQMLESGIGSNLVTKADLQTIEKLTVEFVDELSILGVKVAGLEDDMQIVREDVAMLKRDVDGIKDYMAKGGMEKVKLTGDMLVRHTNLTHKHDWSTYNQPAGAVLPVALLQPNANPRAGNSDNALTESQISFTFTANIDENIQAVSRWYVFAKNVDNVNGGQSGMQGAFGRNTIGVNTVTDSVVDLAYLRVKDMFRFGGDFTFGRNFYTEGHGLLLHNYVDAVRYAKRSGDVDLVFQAIYDRHVGSFNDSSAVDFRNVWNLNLATSYRDHALYLGIYAQEEPNLANRRHPLFNSVTNPQPAFVLNSPIVANSGCQSEDARWDVEFGSKGPIGKNGHWDYDLAFAYTNYELEVVDGGTVATAFIDPEMQGWMGHVAVKWDSKKEWAAKLAYTFADDESLGAISIDNDQRYADGPETPYEDISRGNQYFRNGLMNMGALKLQAEYRPRNTRHYFRVAGDFLDELDETVSNDLARHQAGHGVAVPAAFNKTNTAYDTWNNFGIAEARAMVLTFEYRYQLATNTRIRIGYTNFEFEGDAQKAGWANGAASAVTPAVPAGGGLGWDYDYQMFWSEIYSQF